MRIKFTGYVDFPETPDDRGSVDHWLCNTLFDGGAAFGLDTDGIMDHFKLTWEEVPDHAADTNK